MDKFKLPIGGKDSDSINRTIRWRGDLYDRIMMLVENNNVSFNRLVNDAVSFALDNMEDNDDKRESN